MIIKRVKCRDNKDIALGVKPANEFHGPVLVLYEKGNSSMGFYINMQQLHESMAERNTVYRRLNCEVCPIDIVSIDMFTIRKRHKSILRFTSQQGRVSAKMYLDQDRMEALAAMVAPYVKA